MNKNDFEKGYNRELEMIAEGLDIAIIEICLIKQVIHIGGDIGYIRGDRSSLLLCFQGGQGLLFQILLKNISSQSAGDFFSGMLIEQFDRGLNRNIMIMMDGCFDII